MDNHWRTFERYRRKKYRMGKINRKRMKPNRKYNKQIRMKNKKLCKKYPWLIPRSRWTGNVYWGESRYDNTELDDMPRGWRKAFGDLWCQDIHEVLVKHNYVDKFRIWQLKEKFGQFRQYFNISLEDLDAVTNNYEVVSEYVCVRCGKLDSPIINNYGWYEPICKECYEKQSWNSVSYEDRLKEAGVESKEDIMIPLQYSINRYKGEEKIETVYSLNDLVTKIRWKNRKKRSNADEVFGGE